RLRDERIFSLLHHLYSLFSIPDLPTCNEIDPGGVREISRWLSAAIPPEWRRRSGTDPGGVAEREGLFCDPSRVIEIIRATCPVVSLALNHRLISVTPPGSIYSSPRSAT